MEKRKIIFDCDIGCDDAVALIALLCSDEAEVEAITCVKGNIGVKDVAQNALKVAKLCGRDIPVYAGCSGPMTRDLLKGRDLNTLMETVRMEIDGQEVLIHERSFRLPEPDRTPERKHACSYIVERLLESEEKIDICAVGPLTNIGMAIRLDPGIVDHIGTIYIMGGGLHIGNRTPTAEANFYDDPEAAEIVLNSGAHCLVCPIEPCEMGATYTRKDIEDIRNIGGPVAEFLHQELNDFIDRCTILFGGDDSSCCIYDYAAVAPILDETVITEKRRDIVHVDISGGMADGQLVIDRRGMFTNNSNVDVVYQMDAAKLHTLLLDIIKGHR